MKKQIIGAVTAALIAGFLTFHYLSPASACFEAVAQRKLFIVNEAGAQTIEAVTGDMIQLQIVTPMEGAQIEVDSRVLSVIMDKSEKLLNNNETQKFVLVRAMNPGVATIRWVFQGENQWVEGLAQEVVVSEAPEYRCNQ